MTSTNFIYLKTWILLLVSISHVVFSIDKEIPSFVQLPPSIQYYAPLDSLIELKCIAWPSSAKVQFMVTSKKIWPPALNPSKNVVELNPLDRQIGEFISPGRLIIKDQNQLNAIQDQNIHCVSSTDFATVISRPFRVTRSVMSEFGGDLTNHSKTVEKLFLLGNVAIIDCWPPESHPRAEVKFHFNKVEIKNGGKYRIVQWPDGKRVSLLIHSVNSTNNGEYRCIATNPVTRQTKVSSEVITLKVEESAKNVVSSITVPISGILNGTLPIIARKGANVTLFCVMRGFPPPQIQIYNHNNDLTASDRYHRDRNFGLLNIMNLQASDAGSYLCSDKTISSTATLKINEPLNITTRPANIVLDDLSESARFECGISKPSIVVKWFFNGKPITALSNGTIFIPSVAAANLGIYQCVAQDHEEWVSASATLSIKSYNLIAQPSLQSEERVQPPIEQNIDTQEQIITVPNVNRIHDNLAIYVSWMLHKSNLGIPAYVVLQYISKSRFELTWRTPVTIQEKFNHTYYYVTDRNVRPQLSYRIRVHSFYLTGHTITSGWSKDIDFYNVGDTSPVIEESSGKTSDMMTLRWSYHGVGTWPIDTFRVLYRRQLQLNGTQTQKKYGKYSKIDVLFPEMSVTIKDLVPRSTYQLTVYGTYGIGRSRTITKYSPLHSVSIPAAPKVDVESKTSPPIRFFVGLLESWQNNKLLYGSLFALTGFLIVVMLLLLLLCLCRQRKFRNSKDTNTFPYSYKEVNKSSLASNNNNNSSTTLQMPGRMPQYSSQLALQQFHANDGNIDRDTNDNTSQLYRENSAHAMETASLVTDLYSQNVVHGGAPVGHPQYPYEGFSTLPQGYPSNQHGRNNPQYQYFLQQQQQQYQAHIGSIRRDNLVGDSNRDSMIDPSLEMPARVPVSASQQHLLMIQSQESQQRHNMGYYNARAGAMSPQVMMMMGSQQSLEPYGPYRRSGSHKYQGHLETPIALSVSGQPMYQMDHMALEPGARPLSPQYQYMQQQQQQPVQLGVMHPSMMEMYNPSHGYMRPGYAEYPQHSLYRQQYRRSNSDNCGMELGYSYLPAGHCTEIMTTQSRQHTLNSLPEQPIDIGNNNHQQQDSPGLAFTASNSYNNNSSGRHHHRRKPTRNRQQNGQDNPSLERLQGNNRNDMPPMLAPRSKLPYVDNTNVHRFSGHDLNTCDGRDVSVNDCNSECNNTGDQFDPPLQYSTHYDPQDPNDNEFAPNNNSSLIDNLPRIRDVSEYGIPLNNNNNNSSYNKQRSAKHHQQQQYLAPVPPLKNTTTRHNPVSNNGHSVESNPDYYSSATSSERSGPSPPPKYAPPPSQSGNTLISRPEEGYSKNFYYHGDTHC